MDIVTTFKELILGVSTAETLNENQKAYIIDWLKEQRDIELETLEHILD